MHIALFLAICLAATIASATTTPGSFTISFSGLAGPDGTPFTAPYTEGGFTVTPVSGSWYQSLDFGNPVPAISGNTDDGEIEVTDAGLSQFLFTSVDMAGVGYHYVITGQLGDISEFTINSGSTTLSTGFTTISNPNPNTPINELLIEASLAGEGAGPATVQPFSVDNVVVGQVPEPSALVLTGLAAASLALFRRRK